MDTLEPLIECVRTFLHGAGWSLTGLQKTTSYEYEGAWAGSSVRSAYAFFHQVHDEEGEGPSIEVFLDETEDGPDGTIALVVPGPPVGELPRVDSLLQACGALLSRAVPAGIPAPISVSYQHDAARDVARARCKVRFKANVPRVAVSAGVASVQAVLSTAIGAFTQVLADWPPPTG